jgi:hypothetical protein
MPLLPQKAKYCVIRLFNRTGVPAIASEFGNSAKVIVPRSRLGKRVIAFVHSEYISKYPEERKADE